MTDGRGGARAGAGRPKGSKSEEYQGILAEATPESLKLLKELATDSESPHFLALKLIIDKTVPTIKPQSPLVEFDFEGETISEQARCIVAAVAEGKISSTVACELLTAMASAAKIIETQELEERIRELESISPHKNVA